MMVALKILGSAGRSCVAAGLIFTALGSAEAADIPSSPETPPEVVSTDEWVVSTMPYFWMTFWEGDMTINGQTVDMSGTNVFDVLDAGDLRFPPLVNFFEARKGRWGGYLDTTFLGVDFNFSDLSLGPGPATAALGLDFGYVLVNGGLIYTAAEWEQLGGMTAFDLMVGGRYTYYDVDLGVTLPGPVAVTLSDTLDWWDVTLGARLRGRYDNGWNFTLVGDIAGAGLESDFSVQALGTVGRDFRLGRADLTAVAGYRLLYQDWKDGNDAVDVLTHGPLVGLRINF